MRGGSSHGMYCSFVPLLYIIGESMIQEDAWEFCLTRVTACEPHLFPMSRKAIMWSRQGASGFSQGFSIRRGLNTKSPNPLALIFSLLIQSVTTDGKSIWLIPIECWVGKVKIFLGSESKAMWWKAQTFQWLGFRFTKHKVKCLSDMFTTINPDYSAFSRVTSRLLGSLSKLKDYKYSLNIYHVPRTFPGPCPLCFVNC